MKQLTLEQLSAQLQDYLQVAQQEQIMITENGRPMALILGLTNIDPEQWNLQISPEFWQLISDRRQRATIPLDVVISQFDSLETD